MINIKSDVNKALSGNQRLVLLLGGDHVYQLQAPNADEFPRITFFEVFNVPAAHADNRETASRIEMQVSIWTVDENKSKETEIASEVLSSMLTIGFMRSSSTDLYERDTGIYHKAMRFTITKGV